MDAQIARVKPQSGFGVLVNLPVPQMLFREFVGAINEGASGQQLLSRIVLQSQHGQWGRTQHHLIQRNVRQRRVYRPFAGFLPDVNPVLDHAWLLRIEAQTLRQDVFRQAQFFL